MHNVTDIELLEQFTIMLKSGEYSEQIKFCFLYLNDLGLECITDHVLYVVVNYVKNLSINDTDDIFSTLYRNLYNREVEQYKDEDNDYFSISHENMNIRLMSEGYDTGNELINIIIIESIISAIELLVNNNNFKHIQNNDFEIEVNKQNNGDIEILISIEFYLYNAVHINLNKLNNTVDVNSNVQINSVFETSRDIINHIM